MDDLVKNHSPVRWLDIGCGPGFHLASIAEMYPEVEAVGLDYSSSMIRIAQRRVKKLGLTNIHLREEDIREYTRKERYSLVTFLNNGFGNLHEEGTDSQTIREAAIQKIARILDDNGYLIISVYDRAKVPIKYGGNLELIADSSDLSKGDLFVAYRPTPNSEITYYSHWFTEKELGSLGKKAGLEIDFLEKRMSRLLARFSKGEV